MNVFKQIDTDSDAMLSREELSQYLKDQVSSHYFFFFREINVFTWFHDFLQVEAMQQAGGEQAQQAQEMLKDQDKLVEEIFSHEDKDKDGYISHEEFSGPKHDEL